MRIAEDFTGRHYGLLMVLGRVGTDNHRRATWLCECACGNHSIVSSHNLKSSVKSCGCLKGGSTRARRILISISSNNSVENQKGFLGI